MARPRSNFDSNNAQVGQAQSFVIPPVGELNHADFHDSYEAVDTPSWEEEAKLMRFMEEPVEIVISEDNSPNAEQVINLCVNGVNQFIFRGKNQVIKRKFVEVLARSRPETLATTEYTDANGNKATKVIKNHTLRYPFRVINDRNPDGQRWVESILREG